MKLARSLWTPALTLLLLGGVVAADSDTPSYHVIQTYSIPGDGGWDYISVDSAVQHLYVSHGTELDIVDAKNGSLLGQVKNTIGVHGASIAPELRRGFTSNGSENTVTIFDLDTLRPIKKVSVTGTDFILYDSETKRVFPMNEKVTVLDGQTGDKAGELDLGGVPEAAVSDEKGTVYVNLADKNMIAVVDPKALKVLNRYPIPNCTAPTSLSYDAVNQRLFIGCRNGRLAVLNPRNGKSVGWTLICSGVDAGGFDADNHLIFESCMEGVISVIRQNTPDSYELVDTVKTQLWAKTMAFDPTTKRIYLPTAEFEPLSASNVKVGPAFRRKIKPNSFHVLVVAP